VRARRVRGVCGGLFQGERGQRELCGLQQERDVARDFDPRAELLVRARLLRARRRAVHGVRCGHVHGLGGQRELYGVPGERAGA